MKTKNLIFGLIAFIACIGMEAQETQYKPILTEGKKWVFQFDDMHGFWTQFIHSQRYAEVVGDTIVDGRNAKKLYVTSRSTDSKDTDNQEDGGHYRVFFEENGILSDEYGELVNMNLNVGDLMDGYIKILKVDVFQSPIGPLKRIFMSEPDAERPYSMIEGVGYYSTLQDKVRPTDGTYWRLITCYEGETLICTGEDFKDPASIEEIFGNSSSENQYEYNPSQTAYDINGRVVNNPIRGSIVIQNGRKFVIR